MMCQHFFDQIVFVFNPFQFDKKNLESILRAKKINLIFFQILTGFFKDFVHQQFETKTENLNSGRSKINKIRHEIFLVKMKKNIEYAYCTVNTSSL